MKRIAKISEMPEAAKKELLEFCTMHEFKFPRTISDLIEIIRDCGDHEDEKDSCYINNTYIFETNGWRFIASGSQYLKDQCICDEELDDTIDVININNLNKKKLKTKKQKLLVNQEKWESFFKGKTKKEILDKLKHTKYTLK